MLKLVIVDSTAESRSSLVNTINGFLQGASSDLAYLPQLGVQPLTPQELKFHSTPDICIVGPEIATSELDRLGSIRKLLPECPILVALQSEDHDLALIENLARMGADDFMELDLSAGEFFRKLVMLVRRQRTHKAGKLVVVESGKGGLGVTTLCAALGESLALHKQRIVLVDLDFETQDLARFLQTRPFVNENLQLLFDEKRPVTEEFVQQCIVPVWEESDGLFCMAPCHDTEALFDGRSSYARVLISILEVLDSSYDYIIVDVGSARGSMSKTLHRVADHVLFVLNNDPASLYASVDKLTKIRSCMAPNGHLHVACNAATKHGLAINVLQQEFNIATKLSDETWCSVDLAFDARASRWPGSGETAYSDGKSRLAKGVRAILHDLGCIDDPKARAAALEPSLVQRMSSLLSRGRTSTTGDAQLASGTAHAKLEAPQERQRQLPQPSELAPSEVVPTAPELATEQMVLSKLISEPTLTPKTDTAPEVPKEAPKAEELDQDSEEEVLISKAKVA